MHKIKVLNICITNHCNQKCIHCYVNPGEKMNELSVQQYKKMIQKLMKYGLESVHVFGGEPFLYESLPELFTFLGESSINTSIVTNGTIFRKEVLDLIKKYNIFLGITMHGTKKTHEKISNNAGNYEKVLELVKYSVSKEIHFGIITCINKVNKHDYFNMVKDLESLGVETFFIIYFSPIGRGKSKDLSLSNKEWLEFIRNVNEFRMNTGLNFFYEPSILKEKSNVNARLFFREAFNCNAFSNSQIVIDANGDVYPCILLLRNNEYYLGSILDKQLNYEKLNDTILKGCPAYFNDERVDFRLKKGKFIPMCPLATYQLF